MNDQTQPPPTKPCPECGGERVTVQLSTVLQAAKERIAVGFFSSQSKTSYLYALTCTTCGYTALYAEQPGNLI